MPRHQWPLEVQGMEEVLSDGIKVTDASVRELLIEAVLLLRKIEYHLAIASDTDLKEGEI